MKPAAELLSRIRALACSSGVDRRPVGSVNASMTDSGVADSKWLIIGVCVGLGRVQLMRTPCLTKRCDDSIVHTMIASFDSV